MAFNTCTVVYTKPCNSSHHPIVFPFPKVLFHCKYSILLYPPYRINKYNHNPNNLYAFLLFQYQNQAL